MKEMEYFSQNYIIQESGVVYSLISKKLLKPDSSRAYLSVVLCFNGEKKKFTIHRLVANKFIPNPENKPCVNHINGVKHDNRVQNLEWVTYSENEIHSHHVLGKKIIHSDSAKLKMSLAAKGRDMSKLVEASVKARRGIPSKSRKPIFSVDKHKSVKFYDSIKNASIFTGISIGSISNNITGKSKSAGGLKWQYQH